jgi:glutaconate CoA-transferase, subunit A
MREPDSERVPQGELFMSPDVDAARAFFQQKPRVLVDKRVTVQEAVERFIHNGDYIATGGFGSVRLPTAVMHEIVRRRKRSLGFAGHCATHDFQILAAGRVLDRCDISYVIGLELRGMSPNGRRLLESGAVKTTEWSNAGLAWRYKAAAMGVPFLPVRVMLGSDTQRYSAAREVSDPYSGGTYLAVPALFPDVAIIHVHQADPYGNAHIDGITIVDLNLARAAKRLILTAERIVPSEVFRADPARTAIPYWLVDAVCEVPFGSYPGEMPYEYGSDEPHFAEWLEAEKDPDALEAFLDRYIYSTRDFQEYLERAGAIERMPALRALDPLSAGKGSAHAKR